MQTTKRTLKSTCPELTDRQRDRLRALLNPESMAHEGARHGSRLLAALPDPELDRIFLAVTSQGLPPSSLAEDLGKDDAEREALTAALRRLSLVGLPLARELEGEDASDSPPPNPVIGLTYAPGASLEEHIARSATAGKDLDGVAKMASLTSLLEQQLLNLYAHPTRNANPFMLLSQVNQSAGIYLSALEKLHKMQIDAGLLQRQPDRLDVDLQAAGAFQTYIGELDNGARETMGQFAASFIASLDKRRRGRDDAG